MDIKSWGARPTRRGLRTQAASCANVHSGLRLLGRVRRNSNRTSESRGQILSSLALQSCALMRCKRVIAAHHPLTSIAHLVQRPLEERPPRAAVDKRNEAGLRDAQFLGSSSHNQQALYIRFGAA